MKSPTPFDDDDDENVLLCKKGVDEGKTQISKHWTTIFQLKAYKSLLSLNEIISNNSNS